MDYRKIKVTTDGGLEIITLAQPASLNAADMEMGRELIAALRSACLRPEPARAVILTGEGKGFCSGVNLSGDPTEGLRDGDGQPDVGAIIEQVFNPLGMVIRDLPIPLVTAVNGAAAGFGCSLAIWGDIIVAAESAFFLQAFRRVGLVPDGGSSYLLARHVGKARAMEMVLLGERISAAKALEWGLINRCVPDAELMPTAMALARDLAEGPASLGMIRRQVWRSLDAGWADQLTYEREGQRLASKTADFAEGLAAFTARRPAQFKGK